MSDPQAHGGEYSISCNGVPVDTPIQAIRVTQEIGAPTMFEFVMPVESIEDSWDGMTLKQFNVGKEMRIGVGKSRTKRWVTGPITMIWPDLNALPGKPSTVAIAGFDRTVRLRFGTRTRVFEQCTDYRIINEIAKAAELGPIRLEGEPGSPKPYVLQNNESDYAFLRRLCAQRNYELLMEETMESSTLVFRPCEQGLGTDKTLSYYKDFETASLQLTVPERGVRVDALAFDVTTGTILSAEVRAGTARERMGGTKTGYEMASGFPSSAISFERPDLVTSRAVQDFANAQYVRGIAAFIKGKLRLPVGDPTVTAGMNVNLTGLGGPFNGLYYVCKATHEYKDGFYATDIEVKRSGI
jgi:phage protein D